MNPKYIVSIPDPLKREIRIRLSFIAPAGEATLRLPAWIPGSYMIRDFARNIVEISAAGDDRRQLPLRKIDKHSWRIAANGQLVHVDYTVYANDLSVRSAYVDNTHAYFNGTSLYLRIEGQQHLPHDVTLQQIAGNAYAGWCVATTLPSTRVDAQGFGEYQAGDYAQLIDHPVEIGALTTGEFQLDKVTHRIAIFGRHHCDMQRLTRDLLKICSCQAALFGELPLSRYLFLITAVGDGYGGLEHCDSTSLICSRADLPVAGVDKVTDGYRRFLGLCSHEYFHLWNVKRIQPLRLMESLLDQEAHTSLLWAFEGITSYYDDLVLLRSGIITLESWMQLFATTVTRVMRTKGRRRQSVADSSFDAWTKFYKQDENAPNAIISYYAKGALIAFGLDMTLRQRSGDRLSLDDLMRLLWQRHGKRRVGVDEDDVQHLAEELLGEPLTAFFDSYVYGVEELPLATWFETVGIGYRLRPAATLEDTGGACDSEPDEVKAVGILGARCGENPGGAELLSLTDDGAAQRAGLIAGDVIVAIDGLRVSQQDIDSRVRLLPLHATTSLHAFRRDELMEFSFEPQLAEHDTCDLWVSGEAADDSCRRRRTQWLAAHG
jgi:predicted metalloprotease with PDZ domain